jgi:hypothetical protein
MGIWCLLGAFFFWVFSGISAFMKVDNFWRDLTLSRLLGDYTDAVVYAVPWQPVEVFLYFFVVDLPFYGVLLGLGTLFLTINMVVNVR